MTDTIEIDAETERLAHRVALTKGKPVADVVREAIAAAARDAGIVPEPAMKRTPAEKMRLLREISDRFATLPVLDDRSADEIIGYDELGLPR